MVDPGPIKGLIAAAAVAALGGCQTTTPVAPAPMPAPGVPLASATVVPVSAVVNQLKCDIGAFLKSQEAPSPYFTIYNVTGTLTFSLERTTTRGWSVAIAPSLPISAFGPTLSANFGRSQSTTADSGDDVVLKFDMATQPDPADDPHGRTAVDQGACLQGLGPDAHLVDPLALKTQIDGIVLGAPKIGFSTVEYRGKFLLKRGDAGKATISLYIISGSFPAALRDSAYTQAFDILLQLQPPPKVVAAPGAVAHEPPPALALHHSTRRAAPPPEAVGEIPYPQLGASPLAPDDAEGLSSHLKRLLDAAPATPPAP